MNVSDMNLRVLQIMSMALSGWARQIDAADVQTLARECGVDEREAVIQLFAAQCGVEDREKIERYFRLSIEKVDADALLRNPYLQTVRFPRKTRLRLPKSACPISARILCSSISGTTRRTARKCTCA